MELQEDVLLILQNQKGIKIVERKIKPEEMKIL